MSCLNDQPPTFAFGGAAFGLQASFTVLSKLDIFLSLDDDADEYGGLRMS